MLGMIRVITRADGDVGAAHGNLVARTSGLSVVSECIPDQPDGVCDDASEAMAVPKIIDLAHRLKARRGSVPSAPTPWRCTRRYRQTEWRANHSRPADRRRT
jgi:hypothetical protein